MRIQKETYQPPISEIKNESEVQLLMEDIQGDLINLIQETRGGIMDLRISHLLKVVEEEGIYSITTGRIKRTLDFSAARDLIQQYRKDSEGGCESCQNLKSIKPHPDETYLHCGYNETEKDVDENTGRSPMIGKNYQTGCGNVNRRFSKTIEQLLRIE